MTKEELIALCKWVENSKDPERAHEELDDALLEYINDKEITEAYNKVHKWYA